MNNYFYYIPPAIEVKIEQEVIIKQNEEQKKNYDLATNDLKGAKIMYQIGLYDNSSRLSAEAGEKYMKSCPNVANDKNHRTQDMYQNMKQQTKVHPNYNDVKFLQTALYKHRYGDSYKAATQEDSYRRLQIACDLKEDVDRYIGTSAKEVLETWESSSTGIPETDTSIVANQFDRMMKWKPK